MPLVAPLCKTMHDLTVSIDSTSWVDNTTNKPVSNTAIPANTSIKVNVIITNVSSQVITTLPLTVGNTGNLLWFYSNAGASPPTACAGGTAPSGSTGTAVSLGLSTDLTPGSSVTVPVIFTSPSALGSYTAYADVVPNNCIFGDASVDSNTGNNISGGATYKVGINTFFETQGGDVGAAGKISVGINSTDPARCNPACATYYQSKYLVVGGSVDPIVNVPTGSGTMINGYHQPLMQFGGKGVYNYFANKFKAKAIANDSGKSACTGIGSLPALTNNFYYCDKDVDIDAVSISGNPVIFINGTLKINGSVVTGISSYPVFIVSGDIKVKSSVTALSGIYIAQKGFNDGYDGGEVSGTANKLTITGALYVDGIERSGVGQKALQLVRHFGPSVGDLPLNVSTPSDVIIFDPGYIPVLNSILATSPVGWKETAP